MLAPKQQPLKPPSPLQPKNAPKTAFSHPQRRCRFHLRLALREQRRRRFHARDLRCPRAMVGPGCGGRGRWRGLAGLRDDAPSEARGADGERAGHRPRAHKAARPTGQHVQRPEHQRSRKQQSQSRIPAAAAVGGGRAWPGFKPTRRATHQRPGTTGVEGTGGSGGSKRAWLRRPWAVAGPGRHHTAPNAPPVWRAPEGPEGTGGLRDRPLRAAGSRVAISRAAGPDGARNTSGARSTTGAQANRPYSPPPPGSGRPV